jgi:hypothetical protein
MQMVRMLERLGDDAQRLCTFFTILRTTQAHP